MTRTMRSAAFLCALSGVLMVVGCATPSASISKLRLGDNPDAVLKKMGAPYTVRAAKQYEGNETSEVWEYIAPVFSAAAFSDKYDKTYWVMFENGKVVQWGEPGDFSGTTTISGSVPVNDYYNKKILK